MFKNEVDRRLAAARIISDYIESIDKYTVEDALYALPVHGSEEEIEVETDRVFSLIRGSNVEVSFH